MLLEWDAHKRQAVLAARGIDFVALAVELFDGRPIITVASPRGDEERFVTIGEHAGRVFALVWTRRDEAVRLITARRARHGETRNYRAHFG